MSLATLTSNLKADDPDEALGPAPEIDWHAVPADDPFRYGWRYVKVTSPDGSEDFKEVPLTLEDVLFPEEGDHHMTTPLHTLILDYLAMVFRAQAAERPGLRVYSDNRIAWVFPARPEAFRAMGPDLVVVPNAPLIFELRLGTFTVTQETLPPTILEVVSEDYRHVDYGRRKDIYEQIGIAQYLIVDPVLRRGKQPIVIHNYELVEGRYVERPPDERGWHRVHSMGLWLSVENDERVACRNGETGEIIEGFTELSRQFWANQEELRVRTAAQEELEEDRRVQRAAQEKLEEDLRVQKAAQEKLERENQRLRDRLAQLERGPNGTPTPPPTT